MHQLSREERLLPLNSVCNVRDLGGYETQDGYFTKSHKYIRGASLAKLSRSDQRYLSEYGLKVVIDLRSADEVKKAPDVYVDHPEVEYYNVDFFQNLGSSLTLSDMDFNDMGGMYIIMVEQLKASVKRIFDIFLDHPYDCILFHCSAGKDRTGVIAALLLELAGCHEYDIVKDYSETFENNLLIYEDLKKMVEDEKHLLSSPTYIMKFLNHIYEKYGSAYAYLQTIGFTRDEVEELKNIFIF